MTTDNYKPSEEPCEASRFSQLSAFPPNTPLGQDLDRFQVLSNTSPQQLPSQHPSALSLTLSAISDSEDPPDGDGHLPPNQTQVDQFDSDLDFDEDEGPTSGNRPTMHRSTDGRSQQPLLKDDGRGRPSYDAPNGSARPAFVARSSTFRSRSPDLEGKSATKKKYTYAAFFLLLSLVSFTIQTETAVYIQHTLGWKKAYCML